MVREYMLTLWIHRLDSEGKERIRYKDFRFDTDNILHDRDMLIVKAKEIIKNIDDYVFEGEKTEAKLLDYKNCITYSLDISFKNEDDDWFYINGEDYKETIGNLSYEGMLLKQMYPEIKLTKKIFEGYEYHVLKKGLNLFLNNP